MRAVASVIVSQAPKHLGGAKLDLLDIDITPGSILTVNARGITVYNLEGFASDHMLHIESLSVAVAFLDALKSAIKRRGKPGEIEFIAVRIQDSLLVYEKTLTTSNVQALIDTLARKESQDGSGSDSLVKAMDFAGIRNFDAAAHLSNATSSITHHVSHAGTATKNMSVSGVAESGAHLVNATGTKITEAGYTVVEASSCVVEKGSSAVKTLTSSSAPRPEKVPQVVVRLVSIQETKGEMVTTFTREHGIPPLPLCFPPIHFDNFSEKVGQLSLSGTIAVLLSTLLQKAMEQDNIFYRTSDTVSAYATSSARGCVSVSNEVCSYGRNSLSGCVLQ